MNWYINRTADIANGDRAASRNAAIMPLAYPGDGNAHVWRVTVTDSGSPASLTGAVPIGYFMRGYDGETVMQTGTVSGNIVSVAIPAEAYAYPGHVTGILRINHGGANMTIDAIAYEIGPNVTGDIIDPGEVIPSIDDLIAQIERMEADTAAAEAAVAQVNDKLAAFDVAIETFYPHSGGVGNIVTVEGTVDAPPAELVIYGKSVQGGTPTPAAPEDIVTAGSGGTLPMVSVGKNLLIPKADGTYTQQGITYVVSDGSISVSGTYTGSAFSVVVFGNCVLPPGSYRFNGQNGVDSGNYKLTLQLFNLDTNQQMVNLDRGTDHAFTLTSATNVQVRIGFRAGLTLSEPAVMTPMIRPAAITDAAFAPYNCVTAAIPTPNGLPGIMLGTGKNLCDASPSFDNIAYASSKWPTADEKHDGHPVLKNAGTWNGQFYKTWLEPGEYVFSLYARADAETTVQMQVSAWTGWSEPQQAGVVNLSTEQRTRSIGTTWQRLSINVTITSAGYTAFRLERSNTATATTLYIAEYQIEAGDALTDFEPYVSPETLAAANHTDTNGQKWICDTIDLEAGTHTQRCGIINSYNGETLPSVWLSSMDVYYSGNTPTSGAKVVYVLATPVVTQLTDVQLTALKSLRGRKGLTNLYSADPAGPEISAELYIDIPTYIQSLLGGGSGATLTGTSLLGVRADESAETAYDGAESAEEAAEDEETVETAEDADEGAETI